MRVLLTSGSLTVCEAARAMSELSHQAQRSAVNQTQKCISQGHCRQADSESERGNQRAIATLTYFS